MDQTLESSFETVCAKRMLSLAGNITSDPSRILFGFCHQTEDLRVLQARLNRLLTAFVPESVKLLNQTLGPK